MIEIIFGMVKIPTIILDALGWMVGILCVFVVLIAIDKALKVLTQNKISFLKIIDGSVTAIRNSVNHRNGSRPLPLNSTVRKIWSYFECVAWGYGCLVFSALFISSVLMFILRSNSIPILQILGGLGIILGLAWATKFAFIETQVAFNKARSV